MGKKSFRTEKDSLGEVQVPTDALWQAQTQRAIDNFPISGTPMPASFIRALGLIKQAAALANIELGLLDRELGEAIAEAAAQVAAGEQDAQFPVDVFQTGSGTSSNMNANEVIASLAGKGVHPNDHVNLGQSSNDVIPTAIQLAVALRVGEHLLPALAHLEKAIGERAKELNAIVKTGRTHLMDAMPLTLGQELSGWQRRCTLPLSACKAANNACSTCHTAVGTGINAHKDFAAGFVAQLNNLTQAGLTQAGNRLPAFCVGDAFSRPWPGRTLPWKSPGHRCAAPLCR